ncbi:MAG: thiamine-phosphate kinase [Chthoniobacterales bacterium]
MNLRALGEDRLLRKILADLPRHPLVISGAGDDCAVTEFPGAKNLLLLKTDCVVEGIHFDAKAKPAEVGWKAMARPLSDFAAMAGLPQFALVTFIARSSTSVAWTEAVYRGLTKAARAFGVAIVGGETSRTDGPVTISVSITGAVERERWVSRSGGKMGDELFVTGRLGGSIRGKHLRFIPRISEARWLTNRFPVHAMMDLSDGLGADLTRLARASGCSFEIDKTAVPRNRGCTAAQALADGEDYELLFALPATDAADLAKAWRKKFRKIPLTQIGRLTRPQTPGAIPMLSGYAHFR